MERVATARFGLAFLRLENDRETLARRSNWLEGSRSTSPQGFEADGGSIEGIGYWNYGMMYVITVAELLREISNGELDLLAQPRLRDIAAYPPGVALVQPNRFVNFGDATETLTLSAGVVNRLAERTGVAELRALFGELDGGAVASEAGAQMDRAAARKFGYNFYSKLPIVHRYAAWWDCTQPAPPLEPRDFFLPDTGDQVVGRPRARAVVFVTKARPQRRDHSHSDIATQPQRRGDRLIPIGARLYRKEYFRHLATRTCSTFVQPQRPAHRRPASAPGRSSAGAASSTRDRGARAARCVKIRCGGVPQGVRYPALVDAGDRSSSTLRTGALNPH